MSPRLEACLWGLRIYGPCSNVSLAEKLGRDREAVYGAVYELRELGLVDRLGPASYDVTEAGRAALAAPAERQQTLFGEGD
jgi:Mn-dependent DtxR family transcriptional regulator